SRRISTAARRFGRFRTTVHSSRCGRRSSNPVRRYSSGSSSGPLRRRGMRADRGGKNHCAVFQSRLLRQPVFFCLVMVLTRLTTGKGMQELLPYHVSKGEGPGAPAVREGRVLPARHFHARFRDWYTVAVTSSVLDPISKLDESAATKRVLLLKPRGFCAGVVRAIDIVKIALETFGAPIYVRREIVHNRYVVNELAEKGAIFVHEIEEVPEGARVIFSAHGVSPAVREISKARHLKVIDATCPLVTKVHIEAVKFAKQGYSLILIGHRDHDEIEGTLGEAPDATQVVSSAAE